MAFAEQLLLAGCSVLFADLRLREEAEDLIAKYPHPSPEEQRPSAVYYKCDQSDWASIAETWAFALRTFPRIDVLCPGAGLWYVDYLIFDRHLCTWVVHIDRAIAHSTQGKLKTNLGENTQYLPTSRIQYREPPSSSFWNPPGISPLSQDDPKANPGSYHLLAVNLMGPIRFAQIVLDYWLQNKIQGNLLIVASMAAYLPMAGTPLYCASKGGLTAFALSLAQFKTRFGIRVACVCPATTFTPCVVQDYCAGKVREEDMNMTAAECAHIMLRLVTEEQYGNGDIVEGMQFATPARGEPSDVRVRAVPYQALMPPVDLEGEFSGKNILVREEELWEQLRTKGMRP